MSAHPKATGLDRREMLAALLGLPALLSGCTAKHESPRLTGQIVGPSEKLGHRLRQAVRPSPAADAWQRCGVVIVGGGIAGLAAAWRLHKAGFHDFTVIEMEPLPGGTSCSGSSDLTAFPWAAHYVPVPMKENRPLISLLDEMGILDGRDAEGEPVVAEQFLCRDPQERIFYKGRWYEGLYLYAGSTAEDRAQLKAFLAEMDRWAAWRNAADDGPSHCPSPPVRTTPRSPPWTGSTMTQWLDRHGWTSPRLRWLVDYSCRDDYGTKSEDTSAWAGVFYFASRIRRPGMRSQPLITWPEGNGRIVAHLYGQAKDQVRLGWLVADIIPHADGGPAGRRRGDAGSLGQRRPRIACRAGDLCRAAVPGLPRDSRLSPVAARAHCASSTMRHGWWRISSSTAGPAAWGSPCRGTTCCTRARRWDTWRPRTSPASTTVRRS